ncbi:hypothetical protein [Tabrizicola sp.]|uniref:hypothetical protein n=1 Tax=Tabrizicola sp. TaxID=2005166 RepID=UPI003F3A8B02
MRRLAALILSSILALPASAETILSEASGTWGGASGQSVFFRAELSARQEQETSRLRIWIGHDDPSAPKLDFDNPAISFNWFAQRQELEVVDTSNGSVLQLTNEGSDGEADWLSVLQIQYIDSQYTVVGVRERHISNMHPADLVPYECELDFLKGKVTVNGETRDLLPMRWESLDARSWTYRTAFDRGYCPES